MNLLVTGGTVVTSLDPVRVEVADVLVGDGRVLEVSPVADASGDDDPGVNRIDARGCVVIPGNVCAHTHLYAALARGMPYGLEPPRDFVDILRRVWWRLDRGLDEGSIRASALVGGMEALLAGTTTVVDHHASPHAIAGSLDIIAESLAATGIRSILAYEVSDRDGPECSAAGLRENRRFAEHAAGGALPLARSMVGAHASFTLSDATLAACVEAAGHTGTGLHVHVAEDAVDQADCRARFGIPVIERLARAGALDELSLLAHGVHLDEREAEAVREAGATVVHNIRSNMNNAVGRPALLGSRALPGSRVALGTDGIGADMFEESRTAWLAAREEGVAPDPRWVLARLAESARVAGRAFGEPLLGRIEAGAPADLVVLDHAVPTPADADTFPGHWVFGLSARNVRDVVVAGEVAVLGHRLRFVGEDWLLDAARAQATRLWGRLATIGEHPFDPRTAPLR